MLNYHDLDMFDLLLMVCRDYAIDPSASLETEDYFQKLLLTYTGDGDRISILTWLRKHLEQNFRAVGERPRWLQGAEWPVIHEQPALFVGQIDIPAESVPPDMFHDTTAFYVFIPRNHPSIVVMQQM